MSSVEQGEEIVVMAALPIVQNFDGTVKALAHSYQTDPDSPYREVRFYTRKYYARLCARIVTDHGDDLLKDIKARAVRRWHEDWCGPEKKLPMAHALIGMFRTLINFGATYIEKEQCERLSAILHRQRFAQGKPRGEAITADQVNAIRAEAHKQGFPSVALAQALQFDLILRQKDVIGEWVPIDEPGTSDIIRGEGDDAEKWLRGLRWNEIDRDLILRHITSKRQKEIEIDLKNAPMVMEELARMTNPLLGAIVNRESTGLPWDAAEFRRTWRRIATACGVPKSVRNMDSRAGAITEATNAGAEMEHVRHAATHGTTQMTQRYSRDGATKTALVQAKRNEGRKAKSA